MRGGSLAAGEGALGSAGSHDLSCGMMKDGGSNLVGSVRSSPRREAPSEILKEIFLTSSLN